MKQQRFHGALDILVLAVILVSISTTYSYAGTRSHAAPRPVVTVPRAYLNPELNPAQLDPLTQHLAAVSHDHTMETLARISVVGGVLLTADRLIRSMDSMKDAPLLLRDDGSSLRVNAVSNRFLLGFTVSRPLDF